MISYNMNMKLKNWIFRIRIKLLLSMNTPITYRRCEALKNSYVIE